MIKNLLLRGVSPNIATKNEGLAPLHLICQAVTTDYIRCEAARVLIEYGADVNLAAKNGYTPLHYAALPVSKRKKEIGDASSVEKPCVDLFLFVLRMGADPEAVAKDTKTPLSLGNDAIVSAYKGGDNQSKELLCGLFTLPVRTGYLKYREGAKGSLSKRFIRVTDFAIFIQKSPEDKPVTVIPLAPFVCCAVDNDMPCAFKVYRETSLPGAPSTVHYFLAPTFAELSEWEGVVQERLHIHPTSPLHDAAVLGDAAYLNKVLLKGCNPDQVDLLGDTPIMRAAVWGHELVVKKLLAMVWNVLEQCMMI